MTMIEMLEGVQHCMEHSIYRQSKLQKELDYDRPTVNLRCTNYKVNFKKAKKHICELYLKNPSV